MPFGGANLCKFGGATPAVMFLATHDVTGHRISRHGAEVARILYYRLTLPNRGRTVLVYLTSDRLVTDQDVVD